jgi:hypothetical protein
MPSVYVPDFSVTGFFVPGVAEVAEEAWEIPMPAIALGIVIGAYLLSRVTGFVIRRVVNRLARRSLGAPVRLWRTRMRRRITETSEMTEQRRRQRVDAASRMLNHLVSMVIWLIAIVTILNLLDINAAFYLSSAGFLGAALAFGGQHKVNDYLTGLTVHFEDRYGVGDEVVFDVGWAEPVRAVVDHVGLFSTRVRDGHSTMHFANAALSAVRNLSQEPAASKIRIRTGGRGAEEVATTLRALAGSKDLTEVVFLGDLDSYQPTTGEVEVDVHTLRPLDRLSVERLIAKAERQLGVEGEILPEAAVIAAEAQPEDEADPEFDGEPHFREDALGEPKPREYPDPTGR